MAAAPLSSAEVALHPGKPLSLIPVGLKEAALDSPTFRATAVHFSDQVEVIERWLEGYLKATTRLVHDVAALEEGINNFIARLAPPANISEAVIDHDYTLLAMKRYGDGARDFWKSITSGVKKMDYSVVEPIRAFLHGELRNFKDARRYLDQSQKNFDNVLSRFASQPKTKEASALREDAFQLYEARKAYIKASVDFCVLAPQVRSTIDKLLVRVFSDKWRELKASREVLTTTFGKWQPEMDRVRGWSLELEAGEKTFRKELQAAGKIFDEKASGTARPSRELEDYSISTIPSLGRKGLGLNLQPGNQGSRMEKAEKQGWLFLRTLTGKPTRTIWVRRWFFVKNGIFGWLVQGSRTGGVEESDRIGVLLCNVKPAFQEERRFCFEVKTKDNTTLLQAETQSELTEWIEAFEMAKRKALENTSSAGVTGNGLENKDAAFSISPPSVPEFAARASDLHGHHGSDELSNTNFERASTLNIPGGDAQGGSLANRSSFDVATTRKPLLGEREEGGRDHAARIIQKLDLHRKSTAGSQLSSNPSSPGPSGGPPIGGIASLISASHNILPVYSAPVSGSGPAANGQVMTDVTIASITAASSQAAKEVPSSSLAPSTLANPPAPTNLSKAAVIVSGERGIGMERSDGTGGMPSGLMANLWGSSNWGHINRLERGELRSSFDHTTPSPPPIQGRPHSESMPKDALPQVQEGKALESPPREPEITPGLGIDLERARSGPLSASHRRTISLDTTASKKDLSRETDPYPANYPMQLKTQEAQFRMLFPNVPKEDKLLLVFRATWNPNDQQDFPGRIYVTANDIYFYSHHLGLVLISGLTLGSIDEVTAAPGKECDFVFLHLKESQGDTGHMRVTIKIFLDNLRLVQRRLNFLVQDFASGQPRNLESLIDELIKIEKVDMVRSGSTQSWDDSPITPTETFGQFGGQRSHSVQKEKNLRRSLRIDQGLYDGPGGSRQNSAKLKLPAHPVSYEPAGMTKVVVERLFDISPKALFHVLCGDKSAVFQLLYRERRATHVKQASWSRADDVLRRDFEYQAHARTWLGNPEPVNVKDLQSIDIYNDHLCYAITDRKTPWHLPHRDAFFLLTKIVITHVAKSRCKLAIYTHIDWKSKSGAMLKSSIISQAMQDLEVDALDLSSVLIDQVRRLGPHSRTRKAIQIFGLVGHQGPIPEQVLAAKTASDGDTYNVPLRALTPRSVPDMLLSLALATLETGLSEVLSLFLGLLRRVWRIASANSIILSLLALSVFSNLLLSSFHTTSWWQERRATRYMTKLGVGPDTTLKRAVHLADLNLTSEHSPNVVDEESRCYQTFLSLTQADSPSLGYPSPSEVAKGGGTSAGLSSTRSLRTRLSRSRDTLAGYRHNLLVAMRVVNEVETAIMRTEWEEWIEREVQRCMQASKILDQGTQDIGRDKEGIKAWYDEYCTSCRRAVEARR